MKWMHGGIGEERIKEIKNPKKKKKEGKGRKTERHFHPSWIQKCLSARKGS